jgi:soluble lytic murein transglycosylase-like protein
MRRRPSRRAVLLLLSSAFPVFATDLPQVVAFRNAWSRATRSPSQALQGFEALRNSEPGLADLIAWGRVRALSKSNPAAEKILLDSLSVTETSPVAVLAREKLIELRYPEGSPRDSTEIPGIQELLGHRLRAGWRARLRSRLLADLVAAHRFHDAEPMALERISESPPLPELRRIAAWFAPDSSFTRSSTLRLAEVQALLSAGRADSALALLDTLKAQRPPNASEWILRGRIQLELGHADEAISAFRHGAEDPREEQAFSWLAKGLEKVGRADDAKIAFSEYARRWPGAPKAQEWLWTSGMDAERNGKCPEATTWYERVKAGGGKRADWARFREGYCWFRVGDYARAERTLAKERREASGSQKDAAWFFLAQALSAQGKTADAKVEFQALSRASPWSFHGHLARRAVGRDSAFADSLRRVGDAPASLWPGERPIRLDKSDSVNLERLLCARETGDDWLAGEVSRRFDESLSGHGEREFALVRWMRSLGMEREVGPRLRRLLGRLSAEEIAKLPKSVMKEFYPMPYRGEAAPLLRGDTLLDISFVHSIMRQESGYDRFARSGVGALGLLQLMPSTGRAMARKTGLKGFRPELLTDPEVNLRLGIAYLRDLSRVWKGRLPLILANYNAGPAPTLRWSPAFDSLPVERAVEEITYWETRDYVKKCMGNYWTYRLLYPETR